MFVRSLSSRCASSGSVAAARLVGATGGVHSFEFHAGRVAAAREDFAKLRLDHVITVQHSDACGVPNVSSVSHSATARNDAAAEAASTTTVATSAAAAADVSSGVGFYTLADGSADAVFLDLPQVR